MANADLHAVYKFMLESSLDSIYISKQLTVVCNK